MARKLTLWMCAVAAVSTWLASTNCLAQDAVLSHLYGTGVHQYFGGNYSQAYDDLSRVIDGGSKDPRAYYFRALTQMRMGNQDAANWDLQAGAALESSDVDRVYPVGKALERVQGPTRRAVERYRALARVESHQRQQSRDATRYEQWRRAESGVLRDPKYTPATPAPEPVAKPPKPEPPAADPFDSDEKPAAPAAGDAPASDDPFEDAPAATTPAAKPPVARPPVAKPPVPEPPTDDAEMADDAKEPAADEKAVEDPFADEAPEKP